MKIKVVPKSGGNSQTFTGVLDILVSKFDGIVYAVLIYGNRSYPTYIPADDYYLVDKNCNLIEISGHSEKTGR